ncbi:MAG: ABC transporter permease [Planctomycetia bacterium]|nr:ABC transporter permease [Planctomycetia bacterium]
MIPVSYNYRNLMVRWRTTMLTAIGFTLVVSLLVVMLAFVRGLAALAENSGHPGNVIILKDGTNDELFSEINIDDVHKTLFSLWSGDSLVQRDPDGTVWVSKEVYGIATQEIPSPTPGGRPSYRFIQIRGMEDPDMAGKVHSLNLQPGGEWFNRSGTQCVLGDGIARMLGLKVGDTFRPRPGLPPLWQVMGILDSAGSPFDSEIWAKREDVGKYFGKDNEETKQSLYTTIVLRLPSYEIASKACEYYRGLPDIKVNAMPEKDYYQKLTENTKTFQVSAIVIAIIMAIGGCFGLMNTMFAAVAQRIKDIGVLRIIGYSKLQILLSFLLESILIAFLGGILGVLIGLGVNGIEQKGQLSSGQGSGKTVVFKMVVDEEVIKVAAIFTIFMGLIGGIIPAVSAMRIKPLDAVR